MNNYPRLVIAGVRGGSGKTTLSLGLIAVLRSQKGFKVIPYKKGPDFIDAGWMSVAAKNPCYSLDPFLISREKVLDSFISHFIGDIAVIEGNRGLYDGMDTEGSYSTAELAKLLKSPVILIVDCTKMTRTTAAVVLGCMNLDKDVLIKGVVLNQVSGSRHETVIRTSIEKYCALPVLGAIPRFQSGKFPERHMGLTPYQEHPDIENAISFVEDIAKKYLDIDRILDIAMGAEQLIEGQGSWVMATGEIKNQKSKIKINELQNFEFCNLNFELKNAPCSLPLASVVRIGVIRDAAFQFYYPENFEELERRGARIVEISALTEKELPDIDALYIGGGFPETHAIALAENVDFRNSLRKAVEEGLPVYAECGGLMYLGESLVLEDKTYPMSGVFPIVFGLEKKPQAHGYSIIEVERPNPCYPEGITLRGHEFHYSRALRIGEKAGVDMAFRVRRGQGIKDRMDGICYRNALATYTHLHALGATEWADGMLRCAMRFKRHYTHNP